MKVVKVEDGLAVRLPEEVVGLLGLKEGDEVEIEAAGGRTLRVGVDPARQAALDRLKALFWELPSDYKFDREEIHERGGRD